MSKPYTTAILLLHCPDKQGIISEVTKFITDNKGNIVYLDQYVDKIEGMFFMRIEWELEGFLIPRDKIYDYIDTLYSQRYQMKFSLYYSDKRPRMAIFVSKMSHCLYDMLARWKAGEFDCEIPCIISNHEDLRYVANQFGIPFYVWSINKDHSNKAEVEAAEMELLRKEDISFIVLARYMQIISDEMIAAYPHHIINIHHSFLPAFIGAKPYHQAYERGVKIIGATSHYVTAELDAGPIIEQDVARITHKDTPESLVLKGKDLEKIVLSRAVSKHIQRKILTYKNKTVIFSGRQGTRSKGQGARSKRIPPSTAILLLLAPCPLLLKLVSEDRIFLHDGVHFAAYLSDDSLIFWSIQHAFDELSNLHHQVFLSTTSRESWRAKTDA